MPRYFPDSSELSKTVYVQLCVTEPDVKGLIWFIEEVDKGLKLVNKVDTNGETLIFYAVHKGFIPVINVLVEKGVELDHVNNYGENLLDCALDKKYSEERWSPEYINFIEQLLAKGFRPNPNNPRGTLVRACLKAQLPERLYDYDKAPHLLSFISGYEKKDNPKFSEQHERSTDLLVRRSAGKNKENFSEHNGILIVRCLNYSTTVCQTLVKRLSISSVESKQEIKISPVPFKSCTLKIKLE